MPTSYDTLRIYQFLAERIELRDFCFRLRYKLNYTYAYEHLGGETRRDKSIYLIDRAEMTGRLGELIFHLVQYWIEDVQGTAEVLVQYGIHEQLGIVRQEMLEDGRQEEAEQALDLLKKILSESSLKELLQLLLKEPLSTSKSEESPDNKLPDNEQGKPAPSPLQVAAEAVLLTLRLVPQNDMVKVVWEANEIGQRTSTFRSPYDAATLPLVIKALDAAQWPNHPHGGPQFDRAERELLTALGLWSGTQVADELHQRVGCKLYDALESDTEGKIALQIVRNYATAQDLPLSYLLRFPPEAVDLAALPWELLWDKYSALLLSRGKPHSCVRYLDFDQALPPPTRPGTTLRILAIAPHADIPGDIRAEERAARKEAWADLIDAGIVQMEELSPITPRSLGDRIREGSPVDIVHFYGHGRYKNGQGALLFDAPGAGKTWLSSDRLAVALGGIRLIVLHACQSAMVGDAGLITGIAPALSAAGVPAVVAMQLTVRIAAATRFTGLIYRALARGESLQHAVSLARQALYVEEDDGASWYVPTLTIRSRNTGSMYLVQRQSGG